MALKHLTDEQIRTWTLEQKDEWWLKNVYRGNMPQLTLRSAAFGMIIGGLLSVTNLYIGAKTGWTLGVGVTSVILAFAFFKVASSLKLAHEFTILENNCMQSIATAAGYMATPLTSSIAAYIMITNQTIPMWPVYFWLLLLGVMGVLFAFPLKRRFINEEQAPFPEGRAAGVVLDALHEGDAKQGLFKAKLLLVTGISASILKVMQSEVIMTKLKLAFLTIPEYLDEWVYKLMSPKIAGIELRELTVRLDSDFVMMAAGGLMGIETGVSLMVGAILSFVILAPWGIHRGDIIAHMVDGVPHYGFKDITMWALWGGAALMTTASLYAFFSKPKLIIDSFKTVFLRKSGSDDVLKDIELPLWLSIVGVPFVGAGLVYLGNLYFGIEIWMGIIAIPLVFVFTVIAAHSTALTSITPIGALGKLTQLTFSVLSPGNIKTNIMTAGITAEVSGNASNLMMDIKPGYMLGGKPRQQAVGHILGVIAGGLVVIPIFNFVFLKGNPSGLISETYPFPSVTVWKAVAEVLTAGLSNLRDSARWSILVGAILGLVFEYIKIKSKGKFWLSGVGVGLAFIMPFNTSLAMFIGSLIFWLSGKWMKNKASLSYKVMVENLEPVCAGVIAGGAVTGILVTILETFVFV